jgi:hypothetical protein
MVEHSASRLPRLGSMTQVFEVSTATPTRDAAMRLAESAIRAGLAAGWAGHSKGKRGFVRVAGRTLPVRLAPGDTGALMMRS